MTTAFQADAFQAVILAFQIDAGAPVTPADDTARSKGGWDPYRFYGKRKKTKRDVEEFINSAVVPASAGVEVQDAAAEAMQAAKEWQRGQLALEDALAEINDFYARLRVMLKEADDEDDDDILLLS